LVSFIFHHFFTAPAPDDKTSIISSFLSFTLFAPCFSRIFRLYYITKMPEIQDFRHFLYAISVIYYDPSDRNKINTLVESVMNMSYN